MSYCDGDREGGSYPGSQCFKKTSCSGKVKWEMLRLGRLLFDIAKETL